MWRACILLVLIAASQTLAQGSGLGKALVARRWANVRTAPNTSSSVVRRVYEGQEFEVLELQGEWVRVKIDERTTGWIFGDLVKLQGPAVPERAPEGVTTVPSSREWIYVPMVFFSGILGTASIYWWLSRQQKLRDYAGRLDRMTSSAYIDNVSRDDVVRLTKAFGIGDRAARSIARQTYLDRYKVSSSHQKLTDKEKGSFRKLQAVLALSDEDVMRIMAKVYKRRRRGEPVET